MNINQLDEKQKEMRLRAFLVDKSLEVWGMTYLKGGDLRRKLRTKYTEERQRELTKLLDEIALTLGISITIDKEGVSLRDLR